MRKEYAGRTDFCAALALSNMEGHLEDLRQQLKEERRKQQNAALAISPMLAWLEEALPEAKQKTDQLRATAEAAPDDESAQKALADSVVALEAMRKSYRQEKGKREREQVEFHLSGLQGPMGTIPLSLLARLADKIADAVHSAAYAIRYGKEMKKVPAELQWDLTLRLVGLEIGSTTLLITGENRRDLFGRSATEESLNALFDVVQAQDGEDLAGAVSRAGARAARAVGELCRLIAGEKAELSMRWQSPDGGCKEFHGGGDRLLMLSRDLGQFSAQPPEDLVLEGSLDTISVNGYITMHTNGQPYTCRYSDELFEQVGVLKLTSPVRADVTRLTTGNTMTGALKHRYILRSIMQTNADIRK